MQAGFIKRDLYGLDWYQGITDLKLWKKENILVELQGDQLCFTWTKVSVEDLQAATIEDLLNQYIGDKR